MDKRTTVEEKRQLDAQIAKLRLDIDNPGISNERRAEQIDLRARLCKKRWDLETDNVRLQALERLDKSWRNGSR